jgi:predicted amidohydrolase
MDVVAVQLDIAWEDKAANHATVERMLGAAAVAPGALLVLPELADTGFSFDLDRIVDDRTVSWAGGLARRLGVFIQAGHAERGPDGRGRNCATLVGPGGNLLGRYEKVHPFSYGREALHYSGGEHLLLRACGDALVAPLICYDLRFPELWRAAVRAGAEVFAIGASWPRERQHHWRSLVVARAIENQAFVVAVNRCGSDPHLRYAGGSLVVSPQGEVLAEAAEEPCLLRASLDVAGLREWRRRFPALRDIRPQLLGSIRVDGPAGAAAP